MKVSIIVPIYNVEQYIEECLNSIYNQELADFEVLCIDDKGNDKSIEKVRKFVSINNITNLKIIEHNKNKGLSEARNTGIKNAKGKYICFLDSDDMLIKGGLKQLIEQAEKNDLDIIEGRIEEKYETKFKIELDEKYKNKKSTEVLSGDEYFAEQCYKKEYLPTAWCRIYNRELVFNNCYFTPNIEFEDEEFSPRAIINAKRVQYIDISLYMYRRRNNSITTSVSNSKWYESYFIIINNLQKFAEEIKEKKSYKFLINRVEEITLSILKNTIEYGTSKEEISYITNEIKTKKLYSIPLKSKNIKMRILGYLMKQPKIFIKLYKAKKGKTKNHNILYKSHEVKRYEV